MHLFQNMSVRIILSLSFADYPTVEGPRRKLQALCQQLVVFSQHRLFTPESSITLTL